MIKCLSLIIINFLFLNNLFCQPDQNYIKRFEGLVYSKHLHEIIKNSIQDSVHWEYQSAPGFQNNKKSLHREIAELGEWSFFPINSKLKEESPVKLLIQYDSEDDILQFPRDAELNNSKTWKNLEFIGNEKINY